MLRLLPSVVCSLVFLTVVFSRQTVFAQTQVGAANGANGTATNTQYPSPYPDAHDGVRSQFLYRASEVMNGAPGWIHRLGFNVTNINATGPIENFTIKIWQTADSTVATWRTAPATVATFSTGAAGSYQPVLGLNMHTLNTPFFWDGTSNLLVELCHAPPLSGGDRTNNVVAVATINLGFAGSRTEAQNNMNANGICATMGSLSPGQLNADTRPVLYLDFCNPPADLAVTGVTSNSASIAWTNPTSAGGTIQYEYGLAGHAAGTGTIVNVPSGDTATIAGLNGATQYSVFIRSNCGATGNTDWIGPVTFTTLPSCGDAFIYADSSGFPPLPIQYDTGLALTWTLCPDVANQALSVDFTLFSLGAGDTLRIYNGLNTDAPLFGAFSGTALPVFGSPADTITATTASGCLTFVFESDTIVNLLDLGWIATLACAPLPADSCYMPLQLAGGATGPTAASFSWAGMFGATKYVVRIEELPTGQPAGQVLTDTVPGTSKSYNNLIAGTDYRFTVYGICTNDANSAVATLTFTTPVKCTGLPEILCGGPVVQFTTHGRGQWDTPSADGPSLGKELLYYFRAPQTRTYQLKLTSAPIAGTVHYFYKPLGANFCDSTGWQYAGDIDNVGQFPPTFGTANNPLQAGVEYAILADPAGIATVSHHFSIEGCTPLNDNPGGAFELIVNAPCERHSNKLATVYPNEPDPLAGGGDPLKRWLDGANKTVWFKFVAPESGTISIVTDSVNITPIGNNDTQVALYRSTDPVDSSMMELLISDEDNSAGGYLGYNSAVTYTGLEPYATYYIQVDGYGTAEGVFCIAVIDGSDRITNSTCANPFVYPAISGGQWVNLYSSTMQTQNEPDLGFLVAAINRDAVPISALLVRLNNYAPDVPIAADGRPYLPSVYGIATSNTLSGPVKLRLFYTRAGFNLLKAAAGLPNATIDDLYVSFFPTTTPDCQQDNNGVVSTLLPGLVPVLLTGDSSFYFEIMTQVLGEFYVHFGATALPLELTSFTAYEQGPHNRLEWVTASERDVRHFAVERAADPAGPWTELGRVAALGDHSGGERRYSFDDAEPALRAYYRLRAEDLDGAQTLSGIVAVTRRSTRLTVLRAFPLPTNGALTLELVAPAREAVTLRCTDVDGRNVFERAIVVEAGATNLPVDLGGLPAGVYFLTLVGEAEAAAPVRVVIGQ